MLNRSEVFFSSEIIMLDWENVIVLPSVGLTQSLDVLRRM